MTVMNIKEIVKKSWLFKKIGEYKREKNLPIKLQNIAYLHDEGSDVLKAIENALYPLGIKYWLQYGTLLGYHREHDFIPHDDDIDMGAFLADQPIIMKALTEAGFERVRHYHVIKDGGMEECYKYKHVLVDFFYFVPEGDVLYCYGFTPKSFLSYKFHLGKKIPFKVIRTDSPKMEMVETTFKGAKVFVPEDTGTYLEAHYGPNFMTPNANYDVFHVATDLQFYPYEENPGYGVLDLRYNI